MNVLCDQLMKVALRTPKFFFWGGGVRGGRGGGGRGGGRGGGGGGGGLLDILQMTFLRQQFLSRSV